MLIRLSLIIAIVASLATAGISFLKVKEKIETLKTERDDWHNKFTATDTELRSTKTELTKTKKDLDTTKQNLATTTSERDQAQKDAAEAKSQAVDLSTKLAKATEDRDNFDRQLSQYVAIGTVAQVNDAIRDAKVLRLDRTNLVVKIANLDRQLNIATNELNKLTGVDPLIILPPELRGKVVAVDPKYDFVVLNIGGSQNLVEGGILLVNRNGKLVAKLKVRSVQPDRAIANVIPGWKLGEVMEGDSVLPGI